MTGLEWLEERRSSSAMSVERISFAESGEWQFENGTLRHRTGGFFSLEGVRATTRGAVSGVWEQPIINQPEIGILGLVAWQNPETGSYHWLVQAKGEPGNVGGVQFGPTVQATYSNYMRKHGGAPTVYLDLFLGAEDKLSSNGLHSEQGTRFLRKFNRNAIRLVSEPVAPANQQFGWVSSADLREALLTDFAVNTDARSVLATGPWALMQDGRTPFLAVDSKLDAELQKAFSDSYATTVDAAKLQRARARIAALADDMALACEAVSLDALSGWALAADGVAPDQPTHAPFTVHHYKVQAPEREKAAWDQPLVGSTEIDDVVLFCQRRDGVMHFLLRPAIEIGLRGGVEIGPSFKREALTEAPVWLTALVDAGEGRAICEVMQSDEGGRFMDSRCRYSLRELPAGAAVDDADADNFWLTLSELEAICGTEAAVTNECRSAVSMVLGFA